MPLGAASLNYTTGGRRQLWDLVLSGSPEISTDQAAFGSTSLKMDGTSEAGSANLGRVAWSGTVSGLLKWPYITIEFEFYPQVRPSADVVILDAAAFATGWEWIFQSNGVTRTRNQDFSTGSSVTKQISSSVLANGSWYHIAMVKSLDTFGYFVDGVSQGTFTNTIFIESTYNRQFLSQNFTATKPIYFIDELRISTVARYEPGVNFTPPSAAFTNDLNTICLYHFEGANGAKTTQDDNS